MDAMQCDRLALEGSWMSVTTVLVPVSETEAEALFAGRLEAADIPGIVQRADRLRHLVAAVDSVREELHAVLFPKWEAGNSKPPTWTESILKPFVKQPPPVISKGYDPFVHLFGRSLPVTGATSRDVVERLAKVLAADEAAALSLLTEGLKSLSLRASERLQEASGKAASTESAIREQLARIDGAAISRGEMPAWRVAYDAITRVSAWSQPVWRLDGEMLPELIRQLGIGLEAGRPLSLFQELLDDHPEWEESTRDLQSRLKDFAGPGAFLSSTDVKLLAGAFRLKPGGIAQNAAVNASNPVLGLRNARLLEEVALYCESENLALAEAAGVEWHDR